MDGIEARDPRHPGAVNGELLDSFCALGLGADGSAGGQGNTCQDPVGEICSARGVEPVGVSVPHTHPAQRSSPVVFQQGAGTDLAGVHGRCIGAAEGPEELPGCVGPEDHPDPFKKDVAPWSLGRRSGDVCKVAATGASRWGKSERRRQGSALGLNWPAMASPPPIYVTAAASAAMQTSPASLRYRPAGGPDREESAGEEQEHDDGQRGQRRDDEIGK